MEKWVLLNKRADFKQIAERYQIDQVTARIIRNRDICSEAELEEYLHGDIHQLPDPCLMHGITEAVDILQEKIAAKQHIRIIGDYDIDGIQSTYILFKGMQNLGAVVSYDIPDRMTDGYGMNESIVERAHAAAIDTIVTCDNGIAAMSAIALAKSYGMTVIVTDHHEIPYELTAEGEKLYLRSEADVIVDPHQVECSYPFKNLCGAVVAYKLMQALYAAEGQTAEAVEVFIENAAIATVGDVMLLQGENRTIVKAGLKKLNQTTNIGMRALILQNHIQFGEIKSYHIGFVLGPCMNASGRLDTAKRALELLLEQDMDRARELALDLVSLNESRKELTNQGVQQAIEYVEHRASKDDKVLVIFLPDCHESIAGIIAGRIRERYQKPTFVLTRGEECVKGSGRSIEAYSMFDEMTKCKELFLKYGGHPMAAGLSMQETDIEELRQRLNANATLDEEDFVEKIKIDVPMPFSYLSMELIRDLAVLEPFGNGNPKPIFAQQQAQISSWRVFGQNQNVLKMKLTATDGGSVDAVYFGAEKIADLQEGLIARYGADRFAALQRGRESGIELAVTYFPEINEYQNMQTIQAKILHVHI